MLCSPLTVPFHLNAEIIFQNGFIWLQPLKSRQWQKKATITCPVSISSATLLLLSNFIGNGVWCGATHPGIQHQTQFSMRFRYILLFFPLSFRTNNLFSDFVHTCRSEQASFNTSTMFCSPFAFLALWTGDFCLGGGGGDAASWMKRNCYCHHGQCHRGNFL